MPVTFKVGDIAEFVEDTFPFAKGGETRGVVTHVYYDGKRIRVKYGAPEGRSEFLSDLLPVEKFRKVAK